MKITPLILSFLTVCTFSSYAQDMTTNPHWNKKACNVCHEGKPKTGKETRLKFGGDIIELCNSCHATISKDKYIHAAGMIPAKDMEKRMPEAFKVALHKDKKDRITCRVCHEINYQCYPDDSKRKAENPRFFRGGPYARRTDICVHCHDLSQSSTQFNPHKQINDKGDIDFEICKYCHAITPDRSKVRGIADVVFQVEDDLNRLCNRCHRSEKNLTGCVVNVNHMVKVSPEMQEKIKKSERELGSIFPLEPATGKIFCGTCHNPHASGVQVQLKAAKGAESKNKLRVETDLLCTACHNKDKT